MVVYVLTFALILPIMIGWILIAIRRQGWRNEDRGNLSPVSRQHFELLQGKELNPQLVEAAKRRFQVLLDRGEEAAVEAKLRPGEQFVFHVRALAELGTDAACNILERQLSRHLSDDHLEQTWYRIDLASGLRQVNRAESLPHLLRCVDQIAEAPLGPVFAAETICFLGFDAFLRQPTTKLGVAALHVTQRVLEGFRICLPPQVVIEGRLGEIIETIWDHRPSPAHAATVRVLHETLRYLRRVPAALTMLDNDSAEREAFQWQIHRLEAIESAIADYLTLAPIELILQLDSAQGADLEDLLLALADLRVDAAESLLPILKRNDDFPEMERALGVLRWSSDPRVGAWLCEYGHRQVDLEARQRPARNWFSPKRGGIGSDVPYVALLAAMRGPMTRDTEEFLILAARDRDPIYRQAAVASLGWWEPIHSSEVIQVLEETRRDAVAEVRRAARAALARLGERSALQWFRQALASDDVTQQHEAIHFVAAEGLTLLWPDLDPLIESGKPEIAYHAREAVVVLSEEMEFSR